MRTTPLKVAVGLSTMWAVALAGSCARQAAPGAVQIDNDDIGGVVTSAKGPEAGVWVIAETAELPTSFVRSAVTDDQGRYVVPDLPKANYNVWVRGYGLVDSPKVQAAPGGLLNLTAVVAPDVRAAAQYYPAGYWASLIEVPEKSEFPGTGPNGNGISPNMKSQAQWMQWMKTGSCYTCHQIGNKATRELPAGLGKFETSSVRPPANPAFCKAGSSHPSAQTTPIATSGRQVAMYDPATRKLTHINTCFETHHLNFAADANDTLWLNGYGSDVVGWVNTKMFDETQDEVKSQGWTALILDTNGNGRRDAYVEPNQTLDPTKDKRISDAFYSVAPAVDGSVWGSVLGFPGAVVRLVPGSKPPATALAERYEVPWEESNAPVNGYGPRGMDVDRNGVVWMGLGSGHLASFDRRKCKGPLDGPTALGRHCPEGWTLYPEPLPKFKNVTDSGSAEGSYYTWVDQFDTLGLGANTPVNTGNQSDGLLALKDGQWVVLRVPYPMGFYVKGMDGRIDDPSLGWKGKGIWTAIGSRTPFHMETGKGTRPKVVHFQVRPDPLAK